MNKNKKRLDKSLFSLYNNIERKRKAEIKMKFLKLKDHFINLEEVEIIIVDELTHCTYVIIWLKGRERALEIRYTGKEAKEISNKILESVPYIPTEVWNPNGRKV